MGCGGGFWTPTLAGYVQRQPRELVSASPQIPLHANLSPQNEVLHSHPASSVPKNNLKAPPLDPANPTAAHAWLPVPSTSSKLKNASGTASASTSPTTEAPGPDVLGRFPPESRKLSEKDLDPYFVNFEASTRELELLLQGNIEKVNRRTLAHLSSLSADLMELGARYNGFSLSEQSPTVAAAIERVGQAADTSYIETEELSTSLGANFAEPMRESAQFASVVRSVLRYRVLKRVQEEMTRDELAKKRTLLDSLERSEMEAKRIEQYLNRSSPHGAGTKPQRSLSTSSATSAPGTHEGEAQPTGPEDTASIDSDFPPTHGESIGSHQPVSPSSPPRRPEAGQPSPAHRKTSSGTFMSNKLFGRISHAVHGFVDVDPERTRRDQIGKTRESLLQVFGPHLALQYSPSTHADANRFIVGGSFEGVRERRQGRKHGSLARLEAVSEGQGDRPTTIHGMFYMDRLNIVVLRKLTDLSRLRTRVATLTGPGKTWKHGRKPKTRLIRSLFGRFYGVLLCAPSIHIFPSAPSPLL